MTEQSEAQAVSDFITAVGGNLADQGFPRIPAFVLMALTASESGRMTAAELAGQLAVSPAAISGAVRYLTTIGFVGRVSEPGSRRHVYGIGRTPWYTASLDRSGSYRFLSGMLRQSAARIPGRPGAQARIEELASFFEFLDRRLPALLEEWNEERRGSRPS